MRKLFLLSLFVILGLLLTSCNAVGSDNNPRLDISMNIQDLTLTSLWEAVLQKTDIQEETANLEGFEFVTDEKGAVILVGYELWGLDKEGQPTFYSIFVGDNGKLSVNSADVSKYPPLVTYNPTVLFNQIDKVGLSSIQSDTDGISISEDFDYSNAEYTRGVFPLYELKEGNLIPLKRVKFGSEPFIGGVEVGMRAINDTPYRPLEHWFLSEDLAKAEVVEYLPN